MQERQARWRLLLRRLASEPPTSAAGATSNYCALAQQNCAPQIPTAADGRPDLFAMLDREPDAELTRMRCLQLAQAVRQAPAFNLAALRRVFVACGQTEAAAPLQDALTEVVAAL